MVLIKPEVKNRTVSRKTAGEWPICEIYNSLAGRKEQVNRMGLYFNPENEAFRQAVTDELYLPRRRMT